MFLGIDLGTSSVKTILIDDNQKTLSTHTENIELLNPQIGFYEQDPETWSKLGEFYPDWSVEEIKLFITKLEQLGS